MSLKETFFANFQVENLIFGYYKNSFTCICAQKNTSVSSFPLCLKCSVLALFKAPPARYTVFSDLSAHTCLTNNNKNNNNNNNNRDYV